MKLFNFFTVGALASEVTLSRTRRDVAYSFSGEEAADFYSDILADISGSTVDEIDQLIMNLQGGEQSRFGPMDEIEVRKFRQLKIVVLWLQNEQLFGRYCYYGCFCLPEGSHNLAQGGYGKPQDNIDRSCKDFKQCYRCLNEEFGDTSKGCAGEESGYRFDLITNADGSKDVQCTNRPGSCRRSICECDLQLARALSKYESEWDESLHSFKGGFDRDAKCVKPVGNGTPILECCGDKTTFPFNTPRRENQCCDGPIAKPLGEC
ncbi:unnamed protein product [Oikopleura dioica]|uniref:Oikosin 49a n=1 Tax=Oikopleura dioica TaxID=34765 RepID=E4XT46_OIKDI|nr:unnamed protein product [Oikopleura dioica]CCG47900.1 oikosin 49a [Oikopleura dioica]